MADEPQGSDHMSNSRISLSLAVTFSAFLLFQTTANTSAGESQQGETSGTRPPITLVIWTDSSTYSLSDTVKLDISLQNTGDDVLYLDRRMQMTGIGGGLELNIENAQGYPVQIPYRRHTIMAPPPQDDPYLLVR